jgi:tetratricopeptide (TPR) repeat protein
MKPSDKLHQLIKSLTASEMQHSRIFLSATLNGTKEKFMQLFDVLHEQEDYDEASVLDQLSDPNFTKNFSSTKHSLYQHILRSLRDFHATKNMDLFLIESLQDVHILFEKRLIKQCKDLVKRTKEIAYKLDRFSIIREVLVMERKLAGMNPSKQRLIDNLQNVFTEQRVIAKKEVNQDRFGKLYYEMIILLRSNGVIRNKQDLIAYDEILSDPLLKNENEALTISSKIAYNNIYSTYHYSKGETEKSMVYLLRCMELWEQRPERIEENPKGYLIILHNILINQLSDNQLEAFNKTLKKLKSIRTKSKGFEIDIFTTYHELLTNYYIRTGKLQKGIKLIPKVIEGFEEFQGKMVKIHEWELYVNFAALYFCSGDYNKVIEWLHKLFYKTSGRLHPEKLAVARIMQLLAHLELQNYRVAADLYKMSLRDIKNNHLLHKFEEIAMDFIKKLAKVQTDKEYVVSLKILKEKLQRIQNDPFEKKAFELFDLISWIDSKLEGKSYSEITKRKLAAVA